MKRNLSKIILFTLIAVMLFGSLNVSAFESYDTYTYSIDGEPLKSPAAYTPDFTTYTSESMELLGGNYWGYYGNDNEVGIWEGNAMHPITYGYDFRSELLKFEQNGQSYTVVGYNSDFLAGYVAPLVSLLEAADELLAAYPKQDKDVEVSNLTFDISKVTAPEGVELNCFNLEEYMVAAVNSAVNELKEADSSKPVVLSLDKAMIQDRWLTLLDIVISEANLRDLLVPATYNKLPVTSIANSAFSLAKIDDDATATQKAAYAVEARAYGAIKNVFISSNVTTVGKEAFKNCSFENVFYDSESSNTWNGEENSYLNNKGITRLCYYSDSVKFGNSKLELATDIVADKDGNLYVTDSKTNRVVVLNKRDFKVIGVMGKFVDKYGNEQSLSSPSGVFVTNPDKMVDPDNSGIYVCDTDNKRIVVFKHDTYEFDRIIEEPDSGLLDGDDFQLHSIAVDIYGRIFAISNNCYEGVMVLSSDGEFTGFIGAQKVTVDPIQQLWNKYFKTADQRAQELKELPEPFNNITVDEYGFVYVTISFNEKEDLKNQLLSIKEKTPTYSPVKKLNSTGVEIMKRNGFFDPGGEVVLSNLGATEADLSKIIDVSIGNEGSWSILDKNRSRIFTYDSNGNLLFAFGDNGDQVGNGENYVAMTYQVVDGVYNIILLDSTSEGFKITVYYPTEYCDSIMSALHNENVHNHHASIDDWAEVRTKNNNFDLAYIGMGKGYYNLGEYEKAMEMLSSAYETDYYSKAFAEKRKEVLSIWMIPLIIGVVVILLLFFKFLGYAKKKNKATSLKVGRKSYVEELLYVFHLVFHPFDGFWDLKHEKRGSVRAASTILGITVLAFFYQAIGQGYMFNPRGDYSTVFLQVIAILVPVLLWVIANWCLTTLFDGEGSLKDIYIASCYSLAPLPLFVVLSTILSNVFTVSEGSMVTLLVTIGYIWVGLLLFFGMSVTHDYTMGKNVITILGTIVAMAVIMFIAILFSSLVIKMVTFLVAIFTEIFNRF